MPFTDDELGRAKRAYGAGWTIYRVSDQLVASPNYPWEVWRKGLADREYQFWVGCLTEKAAEHVYAASIELQDGDYTYGRRKDVP